jgi:hypothetical protein
MLSIRAYLGAVAVTATMVTSSAFAGDGGTGEVERMAAVHAAVSACLSDRARLCADVAPGQGRIIACLASHSDQLSPICAGGMAQAADALISLGQMMRHAAAVKTRSD